VPNLDNYMQESLNAGTLAFSFSTKGAVSRSSTLSPDSHLLVHPQMVGLLQ